MTFSPEPPTILKKHAPDFIRAVEAGVSGEHEMIIMTIDAFRGEPELLEAALSYAYDRGVAVTFAPDSDASQG